MVEPEPELEPPALPGVVVVEPDVPEPEEPEPELPDEPELPMEPLLPLPEVDGDVGVLLDEAEPPMLVPDEPLGDELELLPGVLLALELELGLEPLAPIDELPLLPGVLLVLPVLLLVCEPLAPEPPLAVSPLPPLLPQADRDITAAAMTARVAPREKVEAFIRNSLVCCAWEGWREQAARTGRAGLTHCLPAL